MRMDAPRVGFGTHEKLKLLVSDPVVSGHAAGLSLGHENFEGI